MIWRQYIHKVVLRLPDSWSNWNFEMLVFEERGRPEQKTTRSKGENQYEYANESHNFANLKFCEVTLLLSFSLFLSALHEYPFIITITCDQAFFFFFFSGKHEKKDRLITGYNREAPGQLGPGKTIRACANALVTNQSLASAAGLDKGVNFLPIQTLAEFDSAERVTLLPWVTFRHETGPNTS